MKTTTIASTALIVALPFAFVSCENPADKTEKAKVEAAVEKTDTPATDGVKYVFTENSRLTFIGSKVTGSHSGGFKTFSGYFSLKDGAPAGSDHKVTIDMNSVFSDSDKLTGHLKSEDFFDTEKYPQSTFDVTSVDKLSDTSYTISGNLTLHGVSKNISFPASVTQEGELLKIDAKFNINRKDFDIVYAGKTDDLIRDEVVIEFSVTAKPEA
ncbi:MAG: YceI family protein [Luteolibacter sp.]